MKEMLTLENIELGALVDTINAELAVVCSDVISRPRKVGAREVTVKITIKPEISDLPDRSVNQPAIDWTVGHKMPGNKGMTTRAFVDGDKVVINTGLPYGGNVNQSTLFDEEKGK